MKKALAIFIFTSILAGDAALAVVERNVLIYNFDGRASIVRNKRSILADMEMPLQAEDLVRVEAGAVLDMSMNFVAGMRLFETSEMRVLGTGFSGMRFALLRGGILVNIRKMGPGGKIQIDTPTSSVVATSSPTIQFSCIITKTPEGKALTTYAVLKGAIDVQTSSATMRVLENQALEVVEDGFIPNQRSSTDEESRVAYEAQQVYITEPELNDSPEL